MNHTISGEILAKEVRFPGSEIFYATLMETLVVMFQYSMFSLNDFFIVL